MPSQDVPSSAPSRVERVVGALTARVLDDDVARSRRVSCLLLLMLFGVVGVASSWLHGSARITDPSAVVGLTGLSGLLLLVLAIGHRDRVWGWFGPLLAAVEVCGVFQL